MANRVLLVLLAKTLVAGLAFLWSMEGVLGQARTESQPLQPSSRISSFVTRRLSESPAQLKLAVAARTPGCPSNCKFNTFLPDCCPIRTGASVGFCTNVLIDDFNCGTCGFTCVAPTMCVCNGECLDLSADPKNCGRCGRKCRKNATCNFGICGYNG